MWSCPRCGTPVVIVAPPAIWRCQSCDLSGKQTVPLEVVTGPPFAGKGWWIADQIERREAAGEVGLVALNYTAMYMALAPGDESAFPRC